MSVQEGWSLARDGILWKRVLSKWSFKETTLFVEQLEASVGPVDMLCGLLLDRIAAAFLRQKILFEVQGDVSPELTVTLPHYRSPDRLKEQVSSPWFVNLLRYENLLNQTFHRDLILLQTLQKAHGAALGGKKPSGSVRGLIEAQTDSAVAKQAVGSAAEPKQYPSTKENDIELGEGDEEDQEEEDQPEDVVDDNSAEVDLD